jgi:hypothetical protein
MIGIGGWWDAPKSPARIGITTMANWLPIHAGNAGNHGARTPFEIVIRELIIQSPKTAREVDARCR